MFATVTTGTVLGIDAIAVTVEANVSAGIGMFLVGLPDNAVKESQERIRSAFENCGFRMTGRRLVVNLAPADIRKEGTGFDLPIALAILAASGFIPSGRFDRYAVAGELSLDGSLKPVRGVLPLALMARKEGLRGIVVPEANTAEAGYVDGLEVVGVRSLTEAVDFLSGRRPAPPVTKAVLIPEEREDIHAEDFSDIRGQQQARRALEIAAAGGHNLIMVGAPGSGKTMLARRISTILPPLTDEEALETTKIHSVAGTLKSGSSLITRRPFRSPHHLCSRAALVGGGTNPHPGEISLAHNGVLFLDEIAEFSRGLLEVLRQPIEDRRITVARARYAVEYPADFMLVAAMNPCPCGYYGHREKECICSHGAVVKYRNRISGPLMDRIDIHIGINPVTAGEMTVNAPQETSESIRRRVIDARSVQTARFAGVDGVHTNAAMNTAMMNRFCIMEQPAADLLAAAMDRMHLSARAYDRIRKVARTIADLGGDEIIRLPHIAEAINYRFLDREDSMA